MLLSSRIALKFQDLQTPLHARIEVPSAPSISSPPLLTSRRHIAGSPSALRHRWFHKLGFRRVDIAYVQPPLEEDMDAAGGLHLLYRPRAPGRHQRSSFLAPLAAGRSRPTGQYNMEKAHEEDGLQTQVLLRFMYMFWCSLVEDMWGDDSGEAECEPSEDVEGELDRDIELFRSQPLYCERTRPLLNLLKATAHRDRLRLTSLPW